MKTTMCRTVAGSFIARDLGSGAWHLTTAVCGGPEIYLAGAAPEAARALHGTRFTAAACEWREEGVFLTLTSADGTQVLKTRDAIIHEPLMHLYESLPLARFDPAARRFWRRVFRLVRIPGGRHLLGLVARRARNSRES
ncbi:MAG: hypothetical protein ACLP2F_10205 [Steroidobacteraceae bacterium]